MLNRSFLNSNTVKLSLIFIFIFGCNKKDIGAIKYFETPSLSKSTNSLKGIVLDKFNIEENLETSFIGNFSIYQDTMYFADNMFGYIFRFDYKGRLIDRHLGKGTRNVEIKGFQYFKKAFNKYYFIDEATNILTIFDEQFHKEKECYIDWNIRRNKKEVLAKPIPSEGDSYEFDFGISEIMQPYDKNHILIAITASHPKFNGYFNTSLYYNYSRILAMVNINSGKVVDLIGRRPPVYLSYNNLPNFDHFSYEIISNDLYVNFWADSTIYIIDKKTKKAVGKFAKAGRGMKTNYVTTQTYKMAKRRWNKDISNYGYYHYLKYIPPMDLLFRGYKKGGNNKVDGLQVYSDHTLLGDIDVPKDFKIIGILKGELIGVITSKKDQFTLFKAKLVYEN